MSVFEPYPMRDTVQHFCEKHLDKIKLYMESLMVRIPLPVKCTIEERKGRKFAKLHYACQGRTGEYCLYKTSFYTMKTRNPRPWIHLMFLALQVLFKVHVQRTFKSWGLETDNFCDAFLQIANLGKVTAKIYFLPRFHSKIVSQKPSESTFMTLIYYKANRIISLIMQSSLDVL